MRLFSLNFITKQNKHTEASVHPCFNLHGTILFRHPLFFIDVVAFLEATFESVMRRTDEEVEKLENGENACAHKQAEQTAYVREDVPGLNSWLLFHQQNSH